MRSYVTMKWHVNDNRGWQAVYLGKAREWRVIYSYNTGVATIYKEDGHTIDHQVQCTLGPVSTLGVIQHLDDEYVKNVGWVTTDELTKRDTEILDKLNKVYTKITGSTADTRNEDVLQMKYIASTVLQEIIETIKNI